MGTEDRQGKGGKEVWSTARILNMALMTRPKAPGPRQEVVGCYGGRNQPGPEIKIWSHPSIRYLILKDRKCVMGPDYRFMLTLRMSDPGPHISTEDHHARPVLPLVQGKPKVLFLGHAPYM